MSAVAFPLSLVWAALTVPLAALLLGVAVTWDGRLFAVAALLLGLFPIIGSNGLLKKRPRWMRSSGWLAIIGAVLAIVVIVRSPTGMPPNSLKVRHLYANPDVHFHRFALGNLLPEVDQLMLGFTLITFVDPLFSLAQSVELKRVTADIYREMDRDADFGTLGSVMPSVYDDLLGMRFDRGHAYLYRSPASLQGKQAPVIVFLHGSGGNFKAYLWLFSKVADRLNAVLIAPSYGMGNWQSPETEKDVSAALAAAQKLAKIDLNNVHVIGLSNGGLGVSQLLMDRSAHLASYTFLSPVFDPQISNGSSSLTILKDRPVFVLTGDDDDRVPLSYVKHATKQMKVAGANVRFESTEQANHFLLFTHRESVLNSLEAWLRDNGAVQP